MPVRWFIESAQFLNSVFASLLLVNAYLLPR